MPTESVAGVLELLELPISDFLRTAYHMILGRSPEPNELAAHGGALRLGLGRHRLLTNIAISPEFVARRTAWLESGDNQAIVSSLYLTYIGRPADPDGLDHYVAALDQGRSRERVRRDIAGSSEARAMATFWYQFDRLVAEERKNGRGFSAWFGRARRTERQRNREFEILNRQHHDRPQVLQGLPDLIESIVYELGALGQGVRAQLSHLLEHTQDLNDVAQSAQHWQTRVESVIEKIDRDAAQRVQEYKQSRRDQLHSEQNWQKKIEALLTKIDQDAHKGLDDIIKARAAQASATVPTLKTVNTASLGINSQGAILRMQHRVKPSLPSGGGK